MKNENTVGIAMGVGAVLAVCLLAGAYLYAGGNENKVSGEYPVPPQEISEEPTLGGANPINPYHYECNGGVCRKYLYSEMAATSSSFCTLTNFEDQELIVEALSATTTSRGTLTGNFVVDVSTSSAAYKYGSSSPAFIKGKTWSDQQNSLRWSGTATTTNSSAEGSRLLGMDQWGHSDTVLRPGESINFRISTSSAGTFTSYWTGHCTATGLVP